MQKDECNQCCFPVDTTPEKKSSIIAIPTMYKYIHKNTHTNNNGYFLNDFFFAPEKRWNKMAWSKTVIKMCIFHKSRIKSYLIKWS